MPSKGPNVQALRSVFRGLHLFRAAYESDGITEIVDHDGNTWTIWDVEYLYDVAVKKDYLPMRQKQAIELFLVKNLPEEEVARLMEIRESNPTGMYASSGIKSLIKLMNEGKIRNVFANDEPKDLR